MGQRKQVLVIAATVLPGLLVLLVGQAIDAYFIAVHSEFALAQFARVLPWVTLLTAVSLGIAHSVNSLVSVERMQSTEVEMQSIRFAIVCLSLCVGVTSMMLLLGVGWFLFGVGLPISGALSFSFYWLLGYPCMVLMMSLCAIQQGYGDPRPMARVAALATIINVLLDPVFIFGLGFAPEMGLAGSAVATSLGCLVGLIYAVNGQRLADYLQPDVSDWWRSLDRASKGLVRFAGANAGLGAIPSLGNLVLVSVVAYSHPDSLGLVAILLVLERLAFNLPMSASIGLIAVNGSNWGSGALEAVKKMYRFAVSMGFVYLVSLTLVGAVCLVALRDLSTTGTEAITLLFLHLVVVGLIGYQMLINAIYQSALQPHTALCLLSVERLVLSPAAFVLGLWTDGLVAGWIGLIAVKLLVLLYSQYYCQRVLSGRIGEVKAPGFA